MKKFCSVIIPCNDKKEARKIARVLLEARLAVCANMIDGVESMFWWQGKIETSSEVLLMLKTSMTHLQKIVTKVEELHSYDCPVVEVLEMKAGNKLLFGWLEQELGENGLDS